MQFGALLETGIGRALACVVLVRMFVWSVHLGISDARTEFANESKKSEFGVVDLLQEVARRETTTSPQGRMRWLRRKSLREIIRLQELLQAHHHQLGYQ